MTTTVHLTAGLREMIARGRLTEAMIPDDFQWLIAALDEAEPDSFARRVNGIIAARVGDIIFVDEIASQLGFTGNRNPLYNALSYLVRAGRIAEAGNDSYIAIFKASGSPR